jgi:hypothetical protein
VDSPEGYIEHHQVDSHPAANEQYYTGADTLTDYGSGGITRLCPPGSERTNAEYAATRRLASARHPKRTSSWKMVGIRPEYRAGDWIGKIDFVDADSSDQEYELDAPLTVVRWDFMAQVTDLGGLLAEYGYGLATP